MRRSWTHAKSTATPASHGSRVWVRRRRWVGTLVLLVAIPALTAVASTAEVTTTLVLDSAQLHFGQHEGYDLVSIDGAVHTTEIGEPMLPAFYVRLLLPPGSTCSNIETSLSGTVDIPGRYDILPSPRPVSFSSERVAVVPQPSAPTYQSERRYPRDVARLAGVSSLGGFRIATVLVTPLQYVAATGELVLHTNIEIAVATEQTGEDESRSSLSETAAVPPVTEMVRGMVANPDDVPSDNTRVISGTRGAGGPDYLIVCPESFVADFEPLRDWKTRKGVPTEIVTLESIVANPLYAGVDDAERVRNCIKSYNSLHGTAWVLLGGDTDVVPSREAHDFFFDQGLPCDLYFADLDGSWNDDGDDKWGEIADDNVDMYADVFVGRAPVTTGDQVATFVEKVLAYEGAPLYVDDDYQLKMLLLGEIMWDSPDPYTDGGVALDMIVDESVPPRFSTVTKLYQRDGTLQAASTVGELESGYGLIIHEGHANVSKVSIGPDDLTATDLDGLSSGTRNGVWYSVGCWSAAIDNDTFGEHWITNPVGGGAAYVGNSRYGWGCPGYPGECVSDLYSQEFFSSLFNKDLLHAGLVHADAKHYFVGLAGIDDYMRYAMYELNLLGDPEMPIWTDRPEPLTVTHPSIVEVENGVATMTVDVAASGVPMEGAVVCVASPDGGVYEVLETQAGGEAVVSFAAESVAEVMLTVTARNCVPYGADVDVEPGGTGIDDGAVRTTALHQNYPNPFNPATEMAFSLSNAGRVTISVYDVAGHRVAVLVDEQMEAGASSVRWDGRDASGRDVASGTYLVRMVAGSELFEKKMTLLR